MRRLWSDVIASHSRIRERIYVQLLATPARDWTVSELARELPGVSSEAARASLYVLLAERLVDGVPGHRSLTFRLNDDGADALSVILRRWRVP